MAGGGFVGGEGGKRAEFYEGNITAYFILACVIGSLGGSLFGYDLGVSGGVTSMDDFLKEFFPSVYKRKQEHEYGMFVGRLACKLYERMRREAAAIKVRKRLRAYQAKKAYTRLKMSVLVLQTGFRAMAARNEFRFRKQTKAATAIQAHWRCHRAHSYHKKLKWASIVTQCRWRARVARRELRKLKMVG